jgi:hypothetical protein
MNKIEKSKWILVLGLCVLMIGSSFAQGDIINDVKEAVKIGASKEVSRFLHQNVDLTINGKMDTYSKTQAEYVLKDFFKKNPPSSFVIVHQGASKAGSPYATGQYMSGTNTFLVWVRIKKVTDKYLIHEMSFIKE